MLWPHNASSVILPHLSSALLFLWMFLFFHWVLWVTGIFLVWFSFAWSQHFSSDFSLFFFFLFTSYFFYPLLSSLLLSPLTSWSGLNPVLVFIDLWMNWIPPDHRVALVDVGAGRAWGIEILPGSQKHFTTQGCILRVFNIYWLLPLQWEPEAVHNLVICLVCFVSATVFSALILYLNLKPKVSSQHLPIPLLAFRIYGDWVRDFCLVFPKM